MAFSSESDFEDHIRELIEIHVLPHVDGLQILGGKKGVDLCLFRNNIKPAIFFIEVKYFNKSKNHSMVAFGSGDGSGFQPAVLRQRPAYLESNLRWVLGSAASENNYYFLSSSAISRHLSGKNVGFKQNGFNRTIFSKNIGLQQEAFIIDLINWLSK